MERLSHCWIRGRLPGGVPRSSSQIKFRVKLSDGLGAVGAARSREWNFAETLRARLGGWSGSWGGSALLQFVKEGVQRQNNPEIDDAGHDHERDRGVEEIANQDWSAIEAHNHSAEIGLAY